MGEFIKNKNKRVKGDNKPLLKNTKIDTPNSGENINTPKKASLNKSLLNNPNSEHKLFTAKGYSLKVENKKQLIFATPDTSIKESKEKNNLDSPDDSNNEIKYWQPQNYNKGDVVKVKQNGVDVFYECITKHSSGVYKKYGDFHFSEVYFKSGKAIRLWVLEYLNFKNFLSGKRVIIVGPSPVLVGKGLGGYIDSFDVVVRMNGGLDVGEYEDYGKKCDVLFTNTVYSKFTKDLIQKCEKNGVKFLFTKIKIKPQQTSIEVLLWAQKDVINKYNIKSPLTGLYVIDKLISNGVKDLTITGFDFYSGSTPDVYVNGYLPKNFKYDKELNDKTHNYELQNKIIKNLINMYDIKLINEKEKPMDKTKIIAEIGINHNGDIEIAKQLIMVAKAAGCDYVKFQKRNPDICVPEDQKSKIRQTPWGEMTYIEYKWRTEFNYEQYCEIDEFCHQIGIKWFVSVWDKSSVDFMSRFRVAGKAYDGTIKIPSALITDLDLCAYVMAHSYGKKIIISTGMSTEEEIKTCVKVCNPDVIMHTNSTYPCPVEELNLNYINWLKNTYPNKEIGYSGHEYGLVTTFATIPMGVTWIERHITLDRNMWGSDHSASIEPSGLFKLVKGIRDIEAGLSIPMKAREVFGGELVKQKSLRK